MYQMTVSKSFSGIKYFVLSVLVSGINLICILSLVNLLWNMFSDDSSV